MGYRIDDRLERLRVAFEGAAMAPARLGGPTMRDLEQVLRERLGWVLQGVRLGDPGEVVVLLRVPWRWLPAVRRRAGAALADLAPDLPLGVALRLR
jgi:hypothetical protein